VSGRARPSILLGGIGGDSHSVGLTVLRQALQRCYEVRYLGPQTRLDDFFRLAPICNVVMISCMDGHARQYLSAWPEMAAGHQLNGVKWYLGGNPTLGNGNGTDRIFLEMGFDRVFTGFVDIGTVMKCLERDLDGAAPAVDHLSKWQDYSLSGLGGATIPAEEKVDEETFLTQRQSVLEGWPTGAGASNLSMSAEFLATQPALHLRHQDVRSGRRSILVQPRSGVAQADAQISLFKALREAGASVLSYQVDSMTRNNNYAGAAQGIRESVGRPTSVLNGFPVVNHGVGTLRRIASEIGIPLQTRHSTRRPRLLAEISYAGGVRAFEGGAICYNIPYYKDYPLQHSLEAWQYVDRLTGLFFDRYDLVLDREFFGTLTATLIPPALAIVTGILEALLAAQQGVKSVSLGYAEQGNRSQDVAAVRAMRSMAKKILSNAGYGDVQVNAVFHQYMAAFPASPGRAAELIVQSAITAALSSATRVLTKSPVEACGIPTLADNIRGVQLTRHGLDLAHRMQVDEQRVQFEYEVIQREVEVLFEHVLLAGNGNLPAGIVRAFELGHLDIPFSPSIYNRGMVLTARDANGAVRFLDPGRLPFDRDLKAFHEDAMRQRCHQEGLVKGRDDHLLVERDVLRVAREEYERWPLGN